MKLITPSCKRFIFTPFKKILHLFKFSLRKPLSVCRRRLRRPRRRRTTGERRIGRSIFRSLTKAREDDGEAAMELKSFSDTMTNNQKAPFPSPLTPAYVRMIAAAGNGREDGRIPDEVDGGDACRRFEKCLAGIVGGERRDNLRDVEDLVYWWENLRCPVFLDLVCRFYRELCKDVFSDNVNIPSIQPDIIRSWQS